MRLKNLEIVAWLAVALVALPIDAIANPQYLARDAGCGICHADRIRLAGPSWAEIAGRYAGDANAADLLFRSTRAGSDADTIKWGGAPKIGVDADTISDDDLRAVIDWILAFASPGS